MMINFLQNYLAILNVVLTEIHNNKVDKTYEI